MPPLGGAVSMEMACVRGVLWSVMLEVVCSGGWEEWVAVEVLEAVAAMLLSSRSVGAGEGGCAIVGS